jgi:hypothetical protein
MPNPPIAIKMLRAVWHLIEQQTAFMPWSNAVRSTSGWEAKFQEAVDLFPIPKFISL